jgi:hypothetical protein
MGQSYGLAAVRRVKTVRAKSSKTYRGLDATRIPAPSGRRGIISLTTVRGKSDGVVINPVISAG